MIAAPAPGEPGCQPEPRKKISAAKTYRGGGRRVEVPRREALPAQGRLVARALRLQRLQPCVLGEKITGPGRPPAVYAGGDGQGRRVDLDIILQVVRSWILPMKSTARKT